MKRILSTMLVAAMLLSLVIVAATVPAAAIDGAWTTWGPANQYAEGYTGTLKSVAGYEYTAEGFHSFVKEGDTTGPNSTIQTKAPVDLKDGVYMLVRVDEFTYGTTNADKWFNINIWDQPTLSPGSKGFGEGVQTLIRPTDAPEGEHGTITQVDTWVRGEFTGDWSTHTRFTEAAADEQGRPLMALTVTWDGSTYSFDINGASATQEVIDWMNEKWGGADSEAYIGFVFQSGNLGGKASATILKFGTSAEDATTPTGDDSRAADNSAEEFADIADPSTVPAGDPAILLTGDKVNSALKSDPTSASGSSIAINDDFTTHVVSDSSPATVYWGVKNEVSYDIDDFPVGVCLTKNFCTCGDECIAVETCNAYLCTGVNAAASAACYITELLMSDEPYMIGDDSYLMFYFDMADEYAPFDANGRIHGARFDFTALDVQTPGKNAFDVMFVAFFRTVEEAESYVEAYLTELGWGAEDDTTETPAVDTTEAPAVDTTEAPVVDTTEAPAVDTTEAKDNTTTEAKDNTTTEAKDNTGDDEPKTNSCKSVVGFGAIAVVAVAAVAGMVAFKKED